MLCCSLLSVSPTSSFIFSKQDIKLFVELAVISYAGLIVFAHVSPISPMFVSVDVVTFEHIVAPQISEATVKLCYS